MTRTAQWSWLVYMAGDNNLEGSGRDDLAEMRRVGSTSDVNVVVQFDTEERGASRFLVEKNRLRTLDALPGVDCGDPAVLTDFLTWGMASFPAATTSSMCGITVRAGRTCQTTTTTRRFDR